MQPDYEKFKTACPGVDKKFLKDHLSRLGEPYFSRFPEKDLYTHARLLSRLSSKHPVEVILNMRREGSVDATVLAFDYPFEFSLITGLLASMGFSILSGDVFTYEQAARSSGSRSRRSVSKKPLVPDFLKRRRIIDHFTGRLDTTLSFKAWAAEFRKKLSHVIGLLEKSDQDSVAAAKHDVNEMVVQRLAQMRPSAASVLYPVKLEIDNGHEGFTRLKVVSQDTPAFLYSLTNALALNGIRIEHVRIRTIGNRIEDLIDLVDVHNRKLDDLDVLDRVRLSVLLTKQFTYFLAEAPDPYTALQRYEQMVRDILRLPEKGKWLDLLTNPHTLQDLAKLLGASDFLWEDFIRLQYETLLPLFGPYVHERRFTDDMHTLPERLQHALEGQDSLEAQRAALNRIKDREIFLIDLEQILHPYKDLHAFAEKLTVLAENVVRISAKLVYEDLIRRFGRPRTVGGIETKLAVMGLGKLGGAALGYASDIELLFVYSDAGHTDGEEVITNAEFFDHLVRGVRHFIRAKREGIFHVDLRLRPYGNAGPLACGLESFCKYYGPEGEAHSYERLALVRMRAVGGDLDFASQVERLRDEMVYTPRSINFEEIRDLREKQFAEKTKEGKLNAKFSAGGLVDLEYGIQMLQIVHSKDVPHTKTPRIKEALDALAEAGMLSMEEAGRLDLAYDFLRHLINGMRMLRGSAQDLFLPPPESDEFDHLARRMGYERKGGLDPSRQLRIDFETHTAVVRAFVERHFGRETLPGPNTTASVVDLLISKDLSKEVANKILREAGFKNLQRAHLNLEKLAGTGERRKAFERLAVLAFDILSMKPDPDMALNNWERFIQATFNPGFHYDVFLSQPMRLEILLSIFSVSQFLADTLIRNPGFLDWVVIPEVLHKTRRREDLENELREAASSCRSHAEWLNKLRRLRRREILRIGTRDVCLGVDPREVMHELSILAEAFIQVVLERIWENHEPDDGGLEPVDEIKNLFCILALGKLGGNELNYSSDIDLLGLYDDNGIDKLKGRGKSALKDLFTHIMESVRSDLSAHTEEGYAYRVDLRLRPFGQSGDLIPSFTGLMAYYDRKASLWEIQAAMKMRPVAGNLVLGYNFLESLRPVLLRRRDPRQVVSVIDGMRREAMKGSSDSLEHSTDIKSGFGGLRDAEFLAQGLQIIHAPDNAMLLEGNTLLALDSLWEAGILPEGVVEQLKKDYIFLRRTEHFLQILEDRQIHSLPKNEGEMDALAKKMLGGGAGAGRFLDDLKGCFERINRFYGEYLVHPVTFE